MTHATRFTATLVLAATLLLVACGNPEKAAQAAIEKAHSAWQAATADLNPTQRLDKYNQVIKDVEKVAKDYPDTTYGKAILADRSAGGVSLASMKQARDAFAPRAACYASPTVACLRPFSSRPNGAATSGNATASGNPLVLATQLVCSKGFAAADGALADMKINKPVYIRDLVQVALSAAKCNKPSDVNAAITAYLTVLPAGAGNRTGALMSILATDALQPAWPMVTKELENNLKTPGLPKNQAAGIVATLSVAYAKNGNTKAALEKMHYLEDTLGYRLDGNSKKEIRTQLILHGHADEGLKYVDVPGNLYTSVVALAQAATLVGDQLKLTMVGTGLVSVYDSGAGKIAERYATPVPAGSKAYYETAASSIEAALDKLAPSLKSSALNLPGADLTYGIVALVYQKLGQPDKASAVMKKGEALRARLLGRSDAAPNLQYFAGYQTTLALVQNKPDAAARYAATTQSPYNYELWIVRTFARNGKVGDALTYIGSLSNPNGNDYRIIIETLVEAGHIDKAEQVVRAIPGGAQQQASYYWMFAYKMATDGDESGARAYVEKHKLIRSPADELRLSYRLLDSKKIGADRKQAEPLLRKMFAIAQQIDKNPSAYRGFDRYTAQHVATAAFEKGYTDLGIELYKATGNRDQRPLLHAFPNGMKAQAMSPVLMLAQDNLQGRRLQYVIDAAIRHLQQDQKTAS